MPRNPERIDEVLEVVGDEWHNAPDLRLGQLLCNIAGGDPFYMEDSELMAQLGEELDCDEFVGGRPNGSLNPE